MIAAFMPHPAWRELIRISARQFQVYRLRMFSWLMMLMFQLYLLRVVWTAVYDGRTSVEGIPADTLLVYLTISSLHRFFLANDIAFNIEERIITGRVASDLIRPFGFMRQMIAIQIGSLAGSVPMLVVVVPIAMLVGSLSLPSLANLPVYLLSLALAFVINVLVWMLVGMLGFWMTNVSGVRAMMSISSDFLAGALVPLWFMPDALRTILALLPFQAVMFLPASIFAGQVTGWDVIRPLTVQIIWIGVLLVLAKAMWIRARARLVVQGG